MLLLKRKLLLRVLHLQLRANKMSSRKRMQCVKCGELVSISLCSGESHIHVCFGCCRRETEFPDLGKGYFRWAWKLIRLPEEKIVECAGYDAAVYQRLSTLGLQTFLFFCIYGLCVLIPVYATAWYALGLIEISDSYDDVHMPEMGNL